MAHTRAMKGGEYGVNGDFYQGGEFLPSSPETVKGEFKTTKVKGKKASKHQYEPYKWDYAPEGKTNSIYELFTGIFGKQDNSGKMIVTCSDQTLNYFGKTREEVNQLADMYNNGIRWIEIK
jgi:hypothetical protein